MFVKYETYGKNTCFFWYFNSFIVNLHKAKK